MEEALISPATRAFIYAFSISTMLTIGLKVTAREILTTLRQRGLITRAIVANIILVPLLGLLLVMVLPLARDATIAIMLLALAPGGMQAIHFTDKVPGQVAFAVGVLFLLTLIAVVVTPVLANIMPLEQSISLPYGRVIRFLVLFLLLPLLIGFAIRRGAPNMAERLYKPMLLVSNISFVGTIFVPMAIKQEAFRALGAPEIAAVLILILGSMAIGWWLGGPQTATRRVFAITTNVRNGVLCLLITIVSFPDRDVHIEVLAFLLLVIPINGVFTVYHIVRDKRRKRV